MHAFRCYIFAARIACDSGPTCFWFRFAVYMIALNVLKDVERGESNQSKHGSV